MWDISLAQGTSPQGNEGEGTAGIRHLASGTLSNPKSQDSAWESMT